MNVDRVSRAVVDRAIDQASARVRTVAALSGALLIGAAAIAYVAFAVLADHFFSGGLPLTIRRIGLTVAAVLIATFTATRVIRPAFRRINQLYSAWLLERARPDLRHAVTTSLLLRGRSDVHAGVSSGLAFQAARAVRRIDVTGVVSDKSLRRAGVAIVSVIIGFGLYGLFAPKQVRPSVLRVLGADVPAPTQTSVGIIAPASDASVVVGTAVGFEVAIGGRIPLESWVEFSLDEGQTWQPGKRLNLTAPDDSNSGAPNWTATRAGADVAATHWYRVHAGDARCEIRKLEVRPQPVVTSHSVEVAWPEYSNRDGTTRSDGPIDALMGSKAALTVRTNVAAADGRVIFHDAAGDFSRQMSIDESDRRTLRAAWIVDRDLEYEVQFNDTRGAENPNPIRYTQRVRGDRPPEITQSQPPAKFSASPTDVFKVRARVTDDWGLSRVTLAYRSTRSNGSIDLVGGTIAEPIVDVDRDISVESLGALPGDVVELHLEATDTRVNLRGASDPQITRGPVCELRVTGDKGGNGNGNKPGAGDRKNAPGPNKGGNQLAGGGNEGTPGEGKGKGGPGQAEKGDKPADNAQARANGEGSNSDKSDAASRGTKSADASKPGEPGKPGGTESQSEKPNAEATESGPTAEGDAPGTAKPTPTDAKDGPTISDDAGEPNGKADKGRNDADARPNDAGAGDDSANAEAELDRLIRQNKGAVDRLGGEEENGDGKPGESSQPDEGEANPSNEKARGDQTKPAAGATGEEKGDKGSGEKSGDAKPKSGSKESKGEASNKGATSEGQSGKEKSAKPGNDAGSNEGEPKSAGPKSGEKSGAGENAGKQSESEAERGPSKDGDPPQGGSPNGTGEAKPGDAQPDGIDNKDKADSGEFAKDPAKNGESKDGPPGAETPKPAEGVGPTPKTSGGGIVEDAGAGEPDGAFEDAKKNEPLDAPMRERARRAVDELERRLRDGASDAELRDLGWSRAEARNFVSRFKRLQTAAQRQRDGGLFSGRVREDNGAAKQSNGDSSSGVGRGMAGAVHGDSRTPKDATHAQDAPPESVPPELRDVLDEYYRSMARQGGATSKPAK